MAKISMVLCIIIVLSSNNCITEREIDRVIGSSKDKTTTFFKCKKKSDYVTALQLLFFFFSKGSLIDFLDADNFGVEKRLNLDLFLKRSRLAWTGL